ncbi:para-nitrobenzyl esterase [Ruminococcus sp. YE71]|uniref:carboxylesterase/lipase family protein n=1 Tax=unclassified Ruminococcus TaxID=2608920 RepID=UPI000887CB83|nr:MULTISPECIES: carboxylesterase family protein [unclassified Ruminococcus]SDA18257.1 para-nitrobenzyl esterase [Ruminococcus sp. YE78]SFW30207.1 para-nitrobenzyl esterase [Ruminococcus sp. YE71]
MLRTTETENGKVRGLAAADPRITAFKGVPFAAPPVGEYRWRAPQPCRSWDGVRDCFDFAPIPMQDRPGVGTDIYCREWHVDPDIPMSEDCLYLNIWTGAKSADERMPVLVWFYGGGFQWGYTAEMEFDGERLARRGIVVVTVSYRLGAFGFLCHPQLTAEQPDAPCNFGMLDQQAALRWVNRNIANFGGDPDNVTIAGQSAGGGSVMAHMACKANEGLFHRAAVMSGIISSPYQRDPFFVPQTLEAAGKKGERLFGHLGVKTLEEARKLDAETIRRKYSELRNAGGMFYVIVQDDIFSTGDPMEAFRKGSRIRVPVLAGNTGDEFIDTIPAATEMQLASLAQRALGAKFEAFLKCPEAHIMTDEGYAPASAPEIGTKSMFLAEGRLADPKPCYYYRFVPDIPGDDKPGTFHSCDLWFFFETLAKCSRPYEGRHYDIARQMCDYLANFVRNGDPNGSDINGNKLPEWRPYTDTDRAEMEFTSEGAVPTVESSSLTGVLLE